MSFKTCFKRLLKIEKQKMGNMFYYPLQYEPISYNREQDYDSFGTKKETKQKVNEIDVLHRKYCRDIFEERKSSSKRKEFITQISDEAYAKRFPMWQVDEIADFKVQFEIFDLNRDGLIDFNEICLVLDEFGDTSSDQERKKYFKSVKNQSLTIDFEQFLLLMSSCMNLDGTLTKQASNFHHIVYRGAQQVKKLRKLTVYKQLMTGIF